MHCSGRDERVLDGNLIQYLLEDRVWIIPEGKSEEVITDRRRSSVSADKETFDLVVNSLKTLHLEVQKSREKYLENQPCLPSLPRTILPPSEIGSNNPLSCPTPNSVSKPVLKDPVSRKKPRGRPKGRAKSLAETGYKKKDGKPKGDNNKSVGGSEFPTKLPAKRKNTQLMHNQNTIEDYYDYVGDVAAYDYVADIGAHDDILQRNGVDWSGPSEAL